MTIASTDRVVVAPNVLFRLVGDEGVLVNLDTEQYLGVNAVGARMWHVLAASDSVQAAYEQLLDEYEVEPAQLRADLDEFIAGLLRQKLVALTADPSRSA
jgi:hypothetical protein